MTSEIAVRPDSTTLAALNGSRAEWADELMSWAAAAQKAHEIATVLCETSFVPKSMAHRPGDVTGAILTAMELGVPIMYALANLDIIDGTPGIRAKALRALVLRAGHEIWVEETNATRAIVCGRRKGSQRIERATWTMDRAKKAELTGKKNWRLFGQDMLVNRATAEVVRFIAPDVLLGVSYTIDELGGDEGPNEPIQATVAPEEAKPAKRRTAQRKTEPEPPKVAPEALPADIPEPPPMTGETLASTCDMSMPHDTRYGAPAGCPPNCPTRRPVDDPPPTVVPDEATAMAVMGAAGFEVVDVIDTLEEPPQNDWPEPAKPPEPDEPPPMMSDPQRRRMAVEMRNAGIVARNDRLDFASEIVGRPINSSNELTVAEASKVIQALVDLNESIQQGLDDAAAEAGVPSEGNA